MCRLSVSPSVPANTQSSHTPAKVTQLTAARTPSKRIKTPTNFVPFVLYEVTAVPLKRRRAAIRTIAAELTNGKRPTEGLTVKCCIVHLALYIWHCTFRTVHLALYISYCTFGTVHLALYISYCTFGTVYLALYISYCTFGTAC